MITIKRVLVATDFSPVAETALVYGRQLARTFGAQLQVLHVVDDFSRFNYADGAGLLPPTAFREEIERTGREKLEAIIRDDDRRELRAVTVLRQGHSTAREIAQYANDAAIDIIVGVMAFSRSLNPHHFGPIAMGVLLAAALLVPVRSGR